MTSGRARPRYLVGKLFKILGPTSRTPVLIYRFNLPFTVSSCCLIQHKLTVAAMAFRMRGKELMWRPNASYFHCVLTDLGASEALALAKTNDAATLRATLGRA